MVSGTLREITIERRPAIFDHWKINERLEELGYKKHQIPYFKKGLADCIQGHWNDNIINYTYDYDSWYCDDEPDPSCDKYPDPKKKHGPVTFKEEAYVAGYESGEEFIKLWVTTITLDFIFGE
jgi:hypothetical protein